MNACAWYSALNLIIPITSVSMAATAETAADAANGDNSFLVIICTHLYIYYFHFVPPKAMTNSHSRCARSI